MDDCRNTIGYVAAGAGDQLHAGRVHPSPAGDCRCRGANQIDSRAAGIVMKHLDQKLGSNSNDPGKRELRPWDVCG